MTRIYLHRLTHETRKKLGYGHLTPDELRSKVYKVLASLGRLAAQGREQVLRECLVLDGHEPKPVGAWKRLRSWVTKRTIPWARLSTHRYRVCVPGTAGRFSR